MTTRRSETEPRRRVRAVFDDETIRVYQAYSAPIAEAAVAAGRFVAPFKRDRMTWIKPSFLWMAYRCGWATKPGQERVLAIDVTRTGFAAALADAAIAHHDPTVHRDHDTWRAEVAARPVRIQWDPERDLHHRPLDHRSIQIGIGGTAVASYVDAWTVRITDVTEQFREVGALVASHRVDDAAALLPPERPYPLDPIVGARIGADPVPTTEEHRP